MSIVHVDIPGLDLVLGGGIRAISRAEGLPESATVLVRGPAGAGKSVFGTQLAGALGRERKCDVAYGCVELLPFELRAQHEGFDRKGERVVVRPFRKEDPTAKEECRIFADVLDIGPPESERTRLGAAIIELLQLVKHSGGNPLVLVIDSLSDGYNLGASAPRAMADGLCKLAAEKGIFLVLLEETVDTKPSVWSFAADIVIHLKSIEDDHASNAVPTSDRRMQVMKNRFGPSHPGEHRFSIAPPSGITIFPHPSSYLSSWVEHFPEPPVAATPLGDVQAWSISEAWPDSKEPADWRRFRTCVTAVYGPDATSNFRLVSQLGTKSLAGRPLDAFDVFVDFARQESEDIEDLPLEDRCVCVPAGNPYLSSHRLLARMRRALVSAQSRKGFVRRVLVGDFQSTRTLCDSPAIRRDVTAFMTILRRAGIPAILFETVPPRSVQEPSAGLAQGKETGVGEPPIVDVADVVIEIRNHPKGSVVYRMSELRKGKRIEWYGRP